MGGRSSKGDATQHERKCDFLEILSKAYVGTPYTDGASHGESRIRPWLGVKPGHLSGRDDGYLKQWLMYNSMSLQVFSEGK